MVEIFYLRHTTKQIRTVNMKILALSLFLLSVFASVAQDKYCISENYREQKWYSGLIERLSREPLIDVSDAAMIKALSSNSHVAAEESWHQVIERYGKIKEEDIIQICCLVEKDTCQYVFTRGGVYCHLFVYNQLTKQL